MKSKVRFDSLHKQFNDTHQGREPEGVYEEYILEMVIKLGCVYDDNLDTIRDLIRRGALSKLQDDPYIDKLKASLETYRAREIYLNRLGEIMREAINIRIRI